MDELNNINTNQSTSLGDLSAEKSVNSCTDYVKFSKMKKRCCSIILSEDHCRAYLKIRTHELYKIKREDLIYKVTQILDRAPSIGIQTLFKAHLRLNDCDFLNFVLKFPTNTRKK